MHDRPVDPVAPGPFRSQTGIMGWEAFSFHGLHSKLAASGTARSSRKDLRSWASRSREESVGCSLGRFENFPSFYLQSLNQAVPARTRPYQPVPGRTRPHQPGPSRTGRQGAGWSKGAAGEARARRKARVGTKPVSGGNLRDGGFGNRCHGAGLSAKGCGQASATH